MGADVRAIHEATDVALWELRTGSLGVFGFNQMLANNGIWYLGWSRYNCGLNTSTTPVACIHHPGSAQDNLTKISLSRLPVAASPQPGFQVQSGYNPANFHFVTFNSGVQTVGAGTQPGSSGSGLLDQYKRLVGVLTGGPLNYSCNIPDYSYYGRFDLAWEGGGTPTTRLKDWLDPGNLNVMTLNSSPANSTTTAGSPNFPETNLISVSGAGMTVCQNGLGLGVLYDGSSVGIEQAEWLSTSGSVQVIANSSNGFTATAFANTFTGQWVTLMVRVRNCAGWSSWRSFQVFVCNGFSGWRFSYGPNPGDDILTIKAVPDETRTNTADLNGKQQAPPAFTAILFNNRAEEVLRGESDNNGQLTLSVSKLPKGVYFLHILGASGELLEKKQIQIGAPLSY